MAENSSGTVSARRESIGSYPPTPVRPTAHDADTYRRARVPSRDALHSLLSNPHDGRDLRRPIRGHPRGGPVLPAQHQGRNQQPPLRREARRPSAARRPRGASRGRHGDRDVRTRVIRRHRAQRLPPPFLRGLREDPRDHRHHRNDLHRVRRRDPARDLRVVRRQQGRGGDPAHARGRHAHREHQPRRQVLALRPARDAAPRSPLQSHPHRRASRARR